MEAPDLPACLLFSYLCTIKPQEQTLCKIGPPNSHILAGSRRTARSLNPCPPPHGPQQGVGDLVLTRPEPKLGMMKLPHMLRYRSSWLRQELTARSPAWPPCSTPVLMASRHSRGWVTWAAFICACSRAKLSTPSASPSDSSLSVLHPSCLS